MADVSIKWPQKTRDNRTAICDSTRWNWFKFRDGDVVVATFAKTGTTWTQQVVGHLILNGEEGALFDVSPWVDFRAIPLELVLGTVEAQEHRRFLKTHLPVDALVFSPKAKYLYIARDGRDMLWSMYNHHAGFTEQAYAMMNTIIGRVGPPLEAPKVDVVQYFREWLDGGGLPLGVSFWEHVQGWWNIRHLPNVKLLHFNNLKADLPGQMREIAKFLDIAIDEAKFPAMVEHCGLDYMRRTASQHSPILDMAFKEGGNTFFNKGTNGRWKDLLTADDLRRYDEAVRANLTPDCAHWVETGELPATAARSVTAAART
jgi:aryl sulfotransferase